jgi:two-component system, OmpR family, sensor histidine kinase VicK
MKDINSTTSSDPDTNSEIMQIFTGAENITQFNLQHFATTQVKIDACFDNIFPSIIASDERIKNGMTELVDRGIKVRLVTEIIKENINYCKEIMKFSEIRHLEGVKGNFGIIDEREYNMHIIHQELQAPTQMIYCKVKSSVEAQQFLFNTLWNKAIPAEERIMEIQEGLKPAFIQTFRDADEIQRIGFDVVKSAKEEILILFSTANSFRRQQKAGLIQVLKDVVSQTDVKIRILTHINSGTSGILDSLKSINNIDFRPLQESLQTRLTTLIVDRKFSLEVEVKDDTKDNSSEAVGLATYSNSESTVWTHTSIFETLWIQAELEDKQHIKQ